MEQKAIRTGKWLIVRMDTGEYYVTSRKTSIGTEHGWSANPFDGMKFTSSQKAEKQAKKLPDKGGFGISEILDLGTQIGVEEPAIIV